MLELIIDVSSLLSGQDSELKIEENLSMTSIDTGQDNLLLVKPVRIVLGLIRSGHDIEAEGTVQTEVSFQCSRCLKDYTQLVTTEVFELFSAQEPLLDEDAYPIVQNKIDLKLLIEDSILLALPLKPLCTASCKGLCPSCGKDQNTEACNCPRDDPHIGLITVNDLLKKGRPDRSENP